MDPGLVEIEYGGFSCLHPLFVRTDQGVGLSQVCPQFSEDGIAVDEVDAGLFCFQKDGLAFCLVLQGG